MKHIFRILLLAVALVSGLMTVSAQDVQVVMTKKVSVLPSTGTNYLDDPFRYFNVQFNVLGAGSEVVEIFFDMDFTVNASSFYFRTKKGKVPSEPIRLKEGQNPMKRGELQTQFKNRLETNVFNNPLTAQQLPEGAYQLCVDVYLWSDRTNPNRVPITRGCYDFDICYSGSAPELISPLAGAQMAMSGAMVVTPARKINFFWTPVISNCVDKNTRFNYQLKVVKVLNGQNYNDAIKYNPTVFTIEVRNNTHAVFDTIRDIKSQMEIGALYVAQVQATAIKDKNSKETFIVANDGKSQPVPFYWDYYDVSKEYECFAEEEDEEGEESEGIGGLTQWEGGVEEVSEWDEIFAEAFPDDKAIVLDPQRHYVESDGYYTIPMTDDIDVGFMPVQSELLKDVSYELALYDYSDDDIETVTAEEPLFSEVIDKLPGNYKMDSHEWVEQTLAGWGAELVQGNLYYMQLSCSFTADYWEYSISDTMFYVNEMLAEHIRDTISRDFKSEEMVYSEGVIFQWGDDPEVPSFMTPQWKAPVDRTGDDIHDPASYGMPTSVPEIQKDKTFPVSWVPVKNVTRGDEVEYEVNVYELKPGQTPEEAVLENEAIVTRTMTNVNEIPETDTKFFRAFSSQKTYVMTLSTNVYGESDTYYHFENGNESIPAVFKIVK